MSIPYYLVCFNITGFAVSMINCKREGEELQEYWENEW
jgi:hypothetical protein